MKKLAKIDEKKIIAAAFLIFSAVYLSLVWNNNVWMDEAFTASLVHTDFAGVIARSMADTLPPLYNIILKAATAVFGYSMPVMKITSVIPMLLTLLMGATVVRKRFGTRTSLLFMLCITSMPLLLYFGVEIRMYSLGFFFATASGIYAYEMFCSPSPKNRILFVLFSTLAGYSHHFAFVTAGFAYLYLLICFVLFYRSRIKEWLLCLLGTFILYLPCLIVTLKQIRRVNGYFSMPDVDAAMLLQYAVYPYTVGFTPASLVCIALAAASVIIFLIDLKSGRESRTDTVFAACSFTVYYGVLTFGTVISRIMSANIFVDRYLFFSVGLLWLSVSVVLGRRKRLFYVALAAALFTGVCSYIIEFDIEYGNSADEEIAFLRENISEGDVYYSIGGHEEMQNCIPFYTYLDKDTAELTYVYPIEEAVRVSLEKGTVLWLSVFDGSEPSPEDMEVLRRNGLTMQKAADFDFDRYKCEFYKVGK